jgi:hypothetical protein
MGFPWV